jgi:hypothetical protein
MSGKKNLSDITVIIDDPIGSLEVGQGEVPCSRAVFERLLLEQGWEIHPTLALVSGLSLRKYVDGAGYFPERLSRQSR